MTKKQALKLKQGDRVKLLSTKKSKLEWENWLLSEEAGTNRCGTVFTVTNVNRYGWLRPEGCTYWHPYDKFEKVSKSTKRKRKNNL